jgi:hypothetical protein
MAKLQPGFHFTGRLGAVSAYKRKDMEDIILRKGWGPSRNDIRSKPIYDLTRRNNKEFGGRSAGSGWILKAIRRLKPLSDYNMAGPLNSLLKPLHLLDTVSEFGQRSIELSKQPGILENFPLNRKNIFEAVVRPPLTVHLDKEKQSAALELPRLVAGRNFFPVGTYPVFSWQVCLSVVPDLFFSEGKGYRPQGAFPYYNTAHYAGPWEAPGSGAEARQVPLNIPTPVEGPGFILLLAAGIQFGTLKQGGGVAVGYAGTGKILKVV